MHTYRFIVGLWVNRSRRVLKQGSQVLLLPQQPDDIKMSWVLQIEPDQRKSGDPPGAKVFNVQLFSKCRRTDPGMLFEEAKGTFRSRSKLQRHPFRGLPSVIGQLVP